MTGIAMPVARDTLSAREKKIFLSKIQELSPDKIGDIWKRSRYKTLNPKEMEQFELLRKHYKSIAGTELPPHASQNKGS
jgi:hypothetical protein